MQMGAQIKTGAIGAVAGKSEQLLFSGAARRLADLSISGLGTGGSGFEARRGCRVPVEPIYWVTLTVMVEQRPSIVRCRSSPI